MKAGQEHRAGNIPQPDSVRMGEGKEKKKWSTFSESTFCKLQTIDFKQYRAFSGVRNRDGLRKLKRR